MTRVTLSSACEERVAVKEPSKVKDRDLHLSTAFKQIIVTLKLTNQLCHVRNKMAALVDLRLRQRSDSRNDAVYTASGLYLIAQ